MDTSSDSSSTQFDTLSSSQSNVEKRKGIKEAYQGKVLVNRAEVLDVHFVPSSKGLSTETEEIDRIVKLVQQNCSKEIESLKDLANSASPVSKRSKTTMVQALKEDALTGGLGNNHLKKLEREMYRPLLIIFRTIEQACHSDRYPRRNFRQLVLSDASSLLSDDPDFPDAFSTKPDFPLAEVAPPAKGTLTAPVDVTVKALRWRQCPAFVEIKASAEQSPVPTVHLDDQGKETFVIKDSFAQGADYARAIASCRPFTAFTYGVFICGLSLCVVRYDTGGALISRKVPDIFGDDIKTFVKVIVRLLCDMTQEQLGREPTATPIDKHTYYSDTYPRFLVRQSVHRKNTLTWRTVGKPLWTSRSLLGRYTWVWLVVGPGNAPMILKVAWRTQNRLPEMTIYDNIKQAFNHRVPEGIVYAWGGGDVIFESGPMSVFQLRRLEALQCDVNKILHRVAFPQVGKPIWEYETPTELLEALLSVLDSLDTLDAKKILHRDISAGNVLIRVTPVYVPATAEKEESIALEQWEPTQALLTDFEFASSPHETTKEVSRPIPVPRSPAILPQEQEQDPFHYAPGVGLSGFPPPTGTRHLFEQTTVTVPPKMVAGDPITGTALFLPLELLSAIRSGISCTRTFAHDVESTAWVLLYAVYRKARRIHHNNPLGCSRCSTLRSKAAQKEFVEKLDAEFSRLFRASGVDQLLQSRRDRLDENSIPYLRHSGISAILTYASECEPSHEALYSVLAGTWDFLSSRTHKPTQSRIQTEFIQTEFIKKYSVSDQAPSDTFGREYKRWYWSIHCNIFFQTGKGNFEEWEEKYPEGAKSLAQSRT